MSVAGLETVDGTAEPAGAQMRHVAPPTSPSRVLCAPLSRFAAVGLVFVAMAIAAAVDGGSLLLHVDEPVQRFVGDHRSAGLDTAFRRISFMGSTVVVLSGGAVLALAAWRRCRVVAMLVVLATLSRPLVEFTLKELVARERPDLDQLVRGIGYSFPSGHPMAAATLWLMVPVVVSLYTPSRRLWWWALTTAVLMVGLIGASRVYLGVHWASDVVAGVLAGAMLLTGLDLGFIWMHERRTCAGGRVAS